ncbi:MAG: hypothetical protein ABL977_03965 [Candidatus Eisenbacteria bacterium]
MHSRLIRLSMVLLLLASAGAAAPEPDRFGDGWHDGKAELDGYRYTVQRYGHARSGRAVAIYVTEPFSRARHVKLDDPDRTPADAVEVLKLNLMRDFQTGIYDYHTMLSVFADAADFAPLKVAFTSTEWCGQVNEELHVGPTGRSVLHRVSSYFEGENTQQPLPLPSGGLQEDALFIVLRGLRGAFLRPGESRTVPFLASAFLRRLTHAPAVWRRATLTRLAAPRVTEVPAGRFECDLYEVRPDDGRLGRFELERAWPHRVIRWQWQAAAGSGALEGADQGELTGSMRIDYWRTHDPGDERLLADIGLAPR